MVRGCVLARVMVRGLYVGQSNGERAVCWLVVVRGVCVR